VLFSFLMYEGRAVKTATDRAAEAIEAAEIMFADEMGATLDLSPAARAALIATVAAAIEAAIAEEHERHMRAVILAVICVLALAPTPLQAAPVPTKALRSKLGVAPSLELVRDGCGRGWHRHHWRDQWGYWHWGRCVPNGW